MKRVILIIAVLVSGILTASAQFFVGGSVGFDYDGGKYKRGSTSTDRTKSLTFQVAPKGGYYFTDRFGVGLDLGLGYTQRKTPNYSGNDDRIVTEFDWQVGGFARYNLIGTEKLSLLLEGGVYYIGNKSKTKTGAVSVDNDPITTFAIIVLPVLSYNLTDRLSIEALCDFLRLGYALETRKSATNKDNKNTRSHFGLGVNAYNPVAHLTYVDSPLFRVGLMFNF